MKEVSKIESSSMAVKCLIALTLFLTGPWLPVFKLVNAVDAVHPLGDNPRLKAPKKHEYNQDKCGNGKIISFYYPVTIICLLMCILYIMIH